MSFILKINFIANPKNNNKRKVKPRSKRGSSRRLTLNKQPSSLMSLGSRGFPNRLRCVHKYVDAFAASIGAGVTTTRVYSCNGMYDPDVTGAGHQPIYFDQLGAIYDHYVVMRSTITVKFLGFGDNQMVSLYIDDDASPTSSPITACEQGSGSLQLVAAANTRPTILKKSWTAKSIFGGDIYDNTALRGSPLVNPTEQSYFVVQFATVSALAYNYTMVVEVVYDAVWTELQNVASS